jgi:flagellin-like protein
MMPTPRWRRGKRRAVSPIIATILLVAITVVLAAVLYILISGLGSTGSKPYQLSFGSGTPGSHGTAFYDNFTMVPTSGLTTGIFGLKITTPAGSPVAVETGTPFAAPTSGWYAVITSASGGVLSTYTSTGWTVTSVTVSSSQTLVIVSAVQLAGTGDSLSAFGTGSSSVSGSINM